MGDFVGTVSGQALGGFSGTQALLVGLQAGDRRCGAVARDDKQIARHWMLGRSFGGAMAAKRIRERVATEMRQGTAAALEAARPPRWEMK